MLELLIISLIFVSVAVFLLSIKLIISNKAKFPSTHVGSNQEMQRRGISCHTSQHRMAQKHKNLYEIIEESNNK